MMELWWNYDDGNDGNDYDGNDYDGNYDGDDGDWGLQLSDSWVGIVVSHLLQKATTAICLPHRRRRPPQNLSS